MCGKLCSLRPLRHIFKLSILSLVSLEPLHTSECRWFFLGQGTCWLICKLTRGKIEHWFVTHMCYQFCKRNTIQQISSLCIHRCSLLAPLGLRRWQVSAQKIPIALDKCKLAKNQECLAMSRWAWFVSAKTAAGRSIVNYHFGLQKLTTRSEASEWTEPRCKSILTYLSNTPKILTLLVPAFAQLWQRAQWNQRLGFLWHREMRFWISTCWVELRIHCRPRAHVEISRSTEDFFEPSWA